jgi:protein SCO1/2
VDEYFAGDGSMLAADLPVTVSTYHGAVLATAQTAVARPTPATATRRFKLTGTVKSVDAADGRLEVQHDDIPGFMGAMTMSYAVGKHEKLAAIAAGDQIQSDVVVSDDGTDLENIKVTRHAK